MCNKYEAFEYPVLCKGLLSSLLSTPNLNRAQTRHKTTSMFVIIAISLWKLVQKMLFYEAQSVVFSPNPRARCHEFESLVQCRFLMLKGFLFEFVDPRRAKHTCYVTSNKLLPAKFLLHGPTPGRAKKICSSFIPYKGFSAKAYLV